VPDTRLPENEQVVMPEGSTCACGQPLPWHLFSLRLGMQHNCSCDTLFKESQGVVKLIGTEHNKIAEWDRSHVWDPKATSEFGTKGAWVQKA
jgi:hypothetical protein